MSTRTSANPVGLASRLSALTTLTARAKLILTFGQALHSERGKEPGARPDDDGDTHRFLTLTTLPRGEPAIRTGLLIGRALSGESFISGGGCGVVHVINVPHPANDVNPFSFFSFWVFA